eukprot:365313-Chlamydomonas_euryale.AAC.27
MGSTEPHGTHGGEWGCMQLMGCMGLNGVDWGCMGCKQLHELDGAAWDCMELHADAIVAI